MKIKSVRHLVFLLIIGLLWFGGLHPNFVMADGHTNLQGQTGSMCNSAHSTDDSCLNHSNQSAIAQFKSLNFKPSVFKIINSFSKTSLSIPYSVQQIRQNFSENQSINKNKLTGTIIKRE